MALVAYSDESDYSDNEFSLCYAKVKDDRDSPEERKSTVTNDNRTFTKPDVIGENTVEGIAVNVVSEPIEERSVKTPNDKLESFEIEENDVVDDVPTLETWNVSRLAQEQNGTIGSSPPLKEPKRKEKLKLILPALTEFDDDLEEVNESDKKKKVKRSSGGTGLFSVLPQPKKSTLFVPQAVTMKSTNHKTKVKPSPTFTKPATETSFCDSDEDETSSKTNTNDFFSLSQQTIKSPTSVSLPSIALDSSSAVTTSPECYLGKAVAVSHPTREPTEIPGRIPMSGEFVNPLQNENPPPSSHTPTSEIDPEALRRLAGRRNATEIANIIDINADDALMSRDEWVTRALCEEKPKKSFSKKREGNPTQQQKRKHQITYLAHQAQEREQDLQNAWGQNRFTKMQTQSKYGF